MQLFYATIGITLLRVDRNAHTSFKPYDSLNVPWDKLRITSIFDESSDNQLSKEKNTSSDWAITALVPRNLSGSTPTLDFKQGNHLRHSGQRQIFTFCVCVSHTCRSTIPLLTCYGALTITSGHSCKLCVPTPPRSAATLTRNYLWSLFAPRISEFGLRLIFTNLFVLHIFIKSHRYQTKSKICIRFVKKV